MILRRFFYYLQHPETAVRYAPIVRILKEKKHLRGRILEVGSGSIGIAPYLKSKVTGVDISFDAPRHHLLEQVKGSADSLPFGNKVFDVVILSDVLEHIPPAKREKALNEAVRVARYSVVVSGPFGKEAFEQDKKLARYSLLKIGKLHPFFQDHLKYGLPNVSDVGKWLDKNLRVNRVRVYGEYFDLRYRELLMKLFITTNKLQYYFYLKGLMPLVPLLKMLNKRPGYRTVVLIELKDD